MNKQEAIGWLEQIKDIYIRGGDEDFDRRRKEAIDIAIKALQGDMYCPSCGVRLVPENEYVEPRPDKESDKK